MTQNIKISDWWLLTVPTAILFYLSLFMTVWLRYPDGLDQARLQTHLFHFTVIHAAWLIVFLIHHLFELNAFRRISTFLFTLGSAMGVNLILAVVYFYAQPNLILTPRRFLLLHVIISSGLIIGWYILVRYLVQRRLVTGVYLFSFNNELAELEREISDRKYLGFRVLGHLNEDSIRHGLIDKSASIVIPDTIPANPAVLKYFYELRTSGILFYNHHSFYELLLRRVYLSQLNELWFMENISYQDKLLYNGVKKIIDLILGIIGFPVFVLTFPFVALLIKIDSSGPVFFTQQRVGRKGARFTIYKYRTMSGGDTNTWTRPNDSRITRIGKLLRLSHLDELPQFINLLRGDVSLVGPRPEQVGIAENLRKTIPFYDERHIIKPGITGWAQLHAYAGSIEETRLKLQYDLYYVKHRSLLFDTEIILKTVYLFFVWSGR